MTRYDHSLPDTDSEDRAHELTSDCWCDPTVIRVDHLGSASVVHWGPGAIEEPLEPGEALGD